MDCSTCHNVHANNTGGLKAYSQRCVSCHKEAQHPKMPAAPGVALADNCIDCHMPSLPPQKIFLQLSDTSKSTPDLVRTHRVAIYPDLTKLYLKKIKG